MSGAMQRRLAVLEARHRSRPSYVVEMTDEELADPALVWAAIAGHQRRTGWAGPVTLASRELAVEEWIRRHGQIEGQT